MAWTWEDAEARRIERQERRRLDPDVQEIEREGIEQLIAEREGRPVEDVRRERKERRDTARTVGTGARGVACL